MSAAGAILREAVSVCSSSALRTLAARPLSTLPAAAGASNAGAAASAPEPDLKHRHRTRRGRAASLKIAVGGTAAALRPFSTTAPRAMATTDAPGAKPATHTTQTRRTGLLATKKGMMTFFDEWGQQMAVTLLKVESNHVLDLVPREDGKHTLVQIGAIDVPSRRIKRSQRVVFKRAGVAPKRELAGFSVTNDAVPAVGTELTAAHFVAGQFVDVKGRSQGKGTQGVMRRWNFKGLPASHGVSLKHRSGGSIGANQDPGRVWKGKKMAGKTGNESSVAHNLKVVKIDHHMNVLYVKGAVPGPPERVVKVRDAVLKTWRGLCFPAGATVPMPTATAEARTVREALAPQRAGRDPLVIKED